MGIKAERRGRQQTDSAAAVRLWVNCFVAIASMFLAAAVIGALFSQSAAHLAQPDEALAATAKITVDGSQQSATPASADTSKVRK
jgi:hypothetical protein